MSDSNVVQQHHVVYEADPTAIQTISHIRGKLHGICTHCQNRAVRVQTVDGQIFEGTIVHVDNSHLYLNVYPDQRFFIPGSVAAYNQIMTLVLYELLVITLLLL